MVIYADSEIGIYQDGVPYRARIIKVDDWTQDLESLNPENDFGGGY